MIRALTISDDAELTERFEARLNGIPGLALVRRSYGSVDPAGAARLIRTAAAGIVFVDVARLDMLTGLVDHVTREAEGVQVIAIGRDSNVEFLLGLMHLGVREYLQAPFEPAEVEAAVARAMTTLAQYPPVFEGTKHVYCFFPAKPGSGASSIAANVAVALSRNLSGRLLLSDFDLSSGVQAFLFKLRVDRSVPDLAAHAFNLDEKLWSQVVRAVDNVDILPAGDLNPKFRIESSQIRHIVDYACRTYSAVIFDLSGNFEQYSQAIMRECPRIFLVCTPEVASLQLAREKLAMLRQLDLDDRVQLIVNRCTKRTATVIKDMEDLVGRPPVAVFGNAYEDMQQAIHTGAAVKPRSELGRHFAEFAANLLEKTEPVGEPTSMHRFLEFVSAPSQSL
jgi:pilus assembly protein CpaE